MNSGYEYVFPAIKGIQAGREYYLSMCPMRLLPRLFLFDEEEIIPELRAQRTLNKNRIPEIARYILDNPKGYVFSAITSSIDGEVRFRAVQEADDGQRIGFLHIPMTARFVINDGQHRRAAIETALRENPDLADETIAVVFFLDIGLARCQQMFADLNRYAIRPAKSIGVLYDQRDMYAKFARLLALKSPVFKDLVEMERSTLAIRSRKLFTLSSLYSATKSLHPSLKKDDFDGQLQQAYDYWTEVSGLIPEWNLVRERKMTAGDVRRDFIHSHGIALQALGKAGHALTCQVKDRWKSRLKKLGTLDWSRSNAALWEGRALIGGRVSKSHHNVILTTNAIKRHLSLELSPEENRVETAFKRGDYGR